MSTAEKLLTIAENVPKVYNAGYEKGKAEGGDNTLLDSVITRTLTSVESDTVKSVARGVFSDFTSLVTVNLPLVETIGEHSFRRCYALSDVNLPNVKTLGNECFYSDENILRIDLPNVTSIAKGVFASATNLETLIIRTEKVCTLVNTSALSSTKIANGEGFIYVPDNLVDSYESATNWSTYANQIKGLSELGDVAE